MIRFIKIMSNKNALITEIWLRMTLKQQFICWSAENIQVQLRC